jgi:hypothetical protein
MKCSRKSLIRSGDDQLGGGPSAGSQESIGEHLNSRNVPNSEVHHVENYRVPLSEELLNFSSLNRDVVGRQFAH